MYLTAYIDNSKEKVVHTTSKKPMKSPKARIGHKGGIVRENCMAKRANRTARSVVGPDSSLLFGQVGVPREICSQITVQDSVTPHNIDRLQRMVVDGRVSFVKTEHGLYHIKKPELSVGKSVKKIADKNAHLKRVGTHILRVGEIVERFLSDGDLVILNRQPTLHKNSMIGCRVVERPGRTIRVNLAYTKGLNMDFDGDEGNLFLNESIEAISEVGEIMDIRKNMLSCASMKSIVTLVQDSMLGLYKLTARPYVLDRHTFNQVLFDCPHVFDRYPDIAQRSRVIRSIRGMPENDGLWDSQMLLSFLFPCDFNLHIGDMNIIRGVLVSGHMTNVNVNGYGIIRHLCLEFGSDVTAKFVDDAQAMANSWLAFCPSTVSVEDCRLPDDKCRAIITDTVDRCFAEAAVMHDKCTDETMREGRISAILNRAKDVGMKLAKEGLDRSNNFIDMITSGSKGDYFNISQIAGLVGQQNINGKRIAPRLNNGTRALPHYFMHSYMEDHTRFESEGFVSSSFFTGLNEKEFFFHAMSGREGMINTSKSTATTGYMQRCLIKTLEDIKTAYNGTVVEPNENVIQFVYGFHGLDTSRMISEDGLMKAFSAQRLQNRANARYVDDVTRVRLSQRRIDRIIDLVRWKTPNVVEGWKYHDTYMRADLAAVRVVPHAVKFFCREYVSKVNACWITPGEAVGIIAAQTIGEKQTQTVLNSFHTAGKLQQAYSKKLEEIVNLNKTGQKTCKVFFKDRLKTVKDVRDLVGSSIVYKTLNDCLRSIQKHPDLRNTYTLKLNERVCYENRINIFALAKTIDACNLAAPDDETVEDDDKEDTEVIGVKATVIDMWTLNVSSSVHIRVEKLLKLKVCGIKNITDMYVSKDDKTGELFVETVGSNLYSLFALPFVDATRTTTNDIHEIYSVFGIAAARDALFSTIQNICSGINPEHVHVLVDKMTNQATLDSTNRFAKRKVDCGPLSKATFEECTDILKTAGICTEIDRLDGLSSAIIVGKTANIGTGYVGLSTDTSMMLAAV